MRAAFNSLFIVFKNYRFILAEQKKRLIFITAIIISESFIPLLQIYLIKIVTNEIVIVIQEKHSPTKAFLFICAQISLFFLLSLLANSKNLIRIKLNTWSSYRFDEITSIKCGKLPLIYYDSSDNYDFLERASNGIGNKVINSYVVLIEIVKIMVTLSGCIFMLYTVHWSLTFILFIFIVPSLFTQNLVSQWNYRQVSSQTYLMRRASYLFNQLRNRSTNKELKFFNHYNFLLNKWSDSFLETANEKYKLEKKTSNIKLGVYGFDNIITGVFSMLLLWIGTRGKLTVGDYVAMSQILSMTVSSVQGISNNIGMLIKDSLFLKDFNNFMGIKEEIGPEHSLSISFPLTSGILVDGISFKYPNAKDYALKNITFHIRPGEKVAVVGANGSGKSTLIKCITGLYKTDYGQILYDGIDLHLANPKELQKNISVVFQDFVQYQLTLKENIVLMDGLSDSEERKLSYVVHESGLKSLVERLPQKLETALGSSLKGGVELSGGEWQKIGIARALFHESEIIILDEPTAALDPMAESELLNKFLQISENRTAIFITHRLGSCIHADKILVLEDGILVESGTHYKLMEKGSTYAKMYESQANWYLPKKKFSSYEGR
ncbi:ABC transporter ATP-binding protein [Paenibacillus thiaminolyticus]|uniref:ABC transporter ATP-binding protein n=1 Tax=Paenibacillus thiaminolyticus TaxID=49283 RepID=A0A3A3GG49_PANTH|nr:ABC transporter ATP-binding protein [Paenibacillus thiaminolyticus]RJG22644.1 ABC transporter ATP-binding protein [Paenibacillus thiaminolyticus]